MIDPAPYIAVLVGFIVELLMVMAGGEDDEAL